MRLFVSVNLPDSLAESIASVQQQFQPLPGVRTTDPTDAHITLQFLGEVEPDRIPAISDALEDAVTSTALAPFQVSLQSLGVFPSQSYIRVIWVGITDGNAKLTRLHDAIVSHTIPLQFEPDTHEFSPHVTIARADHGGGKDDIQQILAARDPHVGDFVATECCLMESTLSTDGPEYEPIARFSFE